MKLEESKKQGERVAKEVREMDPDEVSELKREMMHDMDAYFAKKNRLINLLTQPIKYESM